MSARTCLDSAAASYMVVSVPDTESIAELKFAWWNVYSLAHFDPVRSAKKRWPSTLEEYQSRCVGIDRGLRRIQESYGQLHIIGLAEVTKQAALDLRERLFPGWHVRALDTGGDDSTLSTAVLWSPLLRFSEQPPLAPRRVPPDARPMLVGDLQFLNHCIRFIFCHWAAFDDEKTRRTQADCLSSHVYEYIREPDAAFMHHLVIVGDLNTEPYGLVQEYLHAHRHRARSHDPHHYMDEYVERIHLYNCSWRFMGEHRPHGRQAKPGIADGAGTYYWRDRKSWHTLDHLIVNATLLTDNAPYLDEESVQAICIDEFMDSDRLPRKFEMTTQGHRGVSDHLPIVGRIVLPKGESDAAL